MYLRKLMLFTIISIFAGLLILIFGTSRIVFLTEISRLEQQSSRENIERVRYALQQKFNRLDITLTDWSAWDDTYRFMAGRNQAYINENLTDMSLFALQIDFFVLIDNNGQLVFSKAFDRSTHQIIPVPRRLLQHARPGEVLLQNRTLTGHVAGILELDTGPALVVARPVLTSKNEGPIHGTLILGQFLDKATISDISQTTRLTVGFHAWNDPRLPADVSAARQTLMHASETVKELNSQTIAGYAVIKDIAGQPVLIMKVEQSRVIYQQARHGFALFLLFLCVAGIASVIAVMVILERKILAPLDRISTDALHIGQAGDMTARINLPGNDEISGLADSINDMLKALEASDKALMESETKYRNLVERSNDGIAIIEDKHMRYVNPRLALITGYTMEELQDAPMDVLLHPEVRPAVHALYDSGKTGADISEMLETVLRHKNGTGIPVEINRGVVPYQEKTALLVMIRDVTERKKAEEMLAEEKERLAVTLRSIGDGVITTDTAFRVVLMNKVAEQLTGWTQNEAAGHLLPEVFHIVKEMTRTRCDHPLQRVLRQGVIVELVNQTILIARDQKEKMIAVSGAPIRDHDAAVIGIVLVFRDITEKRRIEEELFKIQRLESVGVLAGGIAHDFNNILAGIIGNISLARSITKGDDMLATCLAEAEKASLRARDLTQQLLTFSKGGAPVKQKSSLAEIITDAAGFVLRGSNVKAEYDLPWDLWLADVDPGQIAQVIHNLTINAMQAMPEGGTMQISARNALVGEGQTVPLPYGRYVQISVRDHGQGIPPEYITKVFDPFFSTKPDGSGLGLTTAHAIVTKHAGLITARSEPGMGTTFEVYLPAARDQSKSDRSHEEALVQGKGSILVMEDEESIRKLLRNTLNLLGYDVTLALNGEEAIILYQEALAAGQGFDAVIMDLTIPGGMGGKEAIKTLREIDPAVKAIVSSGYSNDPVMSHYQDYGFKGMVAKPYKVADLSAVLQEVLKG